MIVLAQNSTVNESSPSSTALLDELMSGLRPIKPEVHIPVEPDPFPYSLVIGSIFGLVSLVLLFFWIRNRSRGEKRVSAEQEALTSLEIVSQEDLGNDDFVMKVSHVLKAYLEEKKCFTAMRQTTEEFFQFLRNSEKLNDHKDTLRTFFAQCDLVKFAGESLANEQRQELIESVRYLVQGIAQNESDER